MTKANVTLQKNILVYGENILIPRSGTYSRVSDLLSGVNEISVLCISARVKARIKKLKAVGFVVVGDDPETLSDGLGMVEFSMVRV